MPEKNRQFKGWMMALVGCVGLIWVGGVTGCARYGAERAAIESSPVSVWADGSDARDGGSGGTAVVRTEDDTLQ